MVSAAENSDRFVEIIFVCGADKIAFDRFSLYRRLETFSIHSDGLGAAALLLSRMLLSAVAARAHVESPTTSTAIDFESGRPATSER